jgi:phage-related minor tail protein
MIKKIIAEFIKLAIINPIINSIFGGISGFSPLPAFGGLFGSAKGNAFSGGRVLPFAKGGVVDGATMFPMKGSKTGLMGEAGPEAILPLKRGPNGRLGVEASGGGGQRPIVFNMNYSFQGGITEQDLARATPKIVEQTKRSVVESVQRGGTFAKSLRGR